MLVAGGSVVLREKFSASGFWKDVRRWDCTLIQYIGELCRYLMLTEPSAKDGKHRLRLACGNGLAPEVWEPFKKRFGIPRILEFYAATEGSVSLVQRARQDWVDWAHPVVPGASLCAGACGL